MVFTKRLRDGIRRGEITCTVRFWLSPRVTVGKRYPMEAGFGVCTYKHRGEKGAVEVDSIERIGFPDITPELACESGFLGVLDLLKVAKHGRGENIYLIRFHYVRTRTRKTAKPKPV
ncbi:MAG TPA: ASCH domain-containing protein [Candidatus Dormibacteraeota bacterium]|jgi:hypothetical protein|nr:ASCH domain-containing protein [Candidatus Dormibacteraeota bacterium]